MSLRPLAMPEGERPEPHRPRSRARSRYVIAISALVTVVGVLALVKFTQISSLIAFGKEMQKAGPPPEAVATAIAQEQRWETMLSAVGSVAAERGVTITNDAAGVVSHIRFDSGAVVKEGQVLVELDASVERAQLASAEARRALARTTEQRTRALAEKGAISKAQLDTDEAQLSAATTDAEAAAAQLARKIVRAPFSGRLGIRKVNEGQYLAPGTAITVLESADALYVDFTLPQEQIAEVAAGMPVRIVTDDAGGGIAGKLVTVEPSLDTTTRTVKLRATAPNEDERLRPGMFVNVRVVLPERPTTVAVPATAIVHAAYGDSVFIVEAAPEKGDAPPGVKIARQQFVRLGESRGDFVAVAEGVKAGEEVVVGGAFKLRNGSRVAVDNKIKPTPELNPRPENR